MSFLPQKPEKMLKWLSEDPLAVLMHLGAACVKCLSTASLSLIFWRTAEWRWANRGASPHQMMALLVLFWNLTWAVIFKACIPRLLPLFHQALQFQAFSWLGQCRVCFCGACLSASVLTHSWPSIYAPGNSHQVVPPNINYCDRGLTNLLWF